MNRTFRVRISCWIARIGRSATLAFHIGFGIVACCLVGEIGAAEVRFNEDVRPILAEHCLHCHGPDEAERQGDLRLDLESAAKEVAIVPGAPDQSLLIERLITEDADLRMPPAETGKPLSSAQVETLRQWISGGAKYQGHWAFEPIRKPEVPSVQGDALTEIDRFVVSQLEARGLQLAPVVSRPQLIRRASLDLIGLPPTWEEVQAFVNDPAADAFARVIDRLLESPRYGERWGRHWLDIARYADTHGGAAIGFKRFPFSYTYRDYVINAFNADLPYDRFVTEQLAADQLGLGENDPALAALGFLTVGMQFRNPHDVIDDQIDVVTRGLMGLTVACARCHDHKYDPIPTADYYSLYATFASSTRPGLLPTVGMPDDTPAYQAYQIELQKRQIAATNMRRDQTQVMRSRLRMQVAMYLRELAKGTPEQDLSAAFLSYRTDDLRPLVLNRWRDYLAELPANDPVFGPWKQLSSVAADDFAARCQELLQVWKTENGDPATFANQHALASATPKWNPRVLAAIEAQPPTSPVELADVYGKMFAELNRQWLQALLDVSLGAVEGVAVITDEDGRYEPINSAVNAQLRRHLYEPGTPTAMDDELASTLLNRTVRDNLNGKEGAIHGLQLSDAGSPPRAMVLTETVPDQPFRIFVRGNPISRGEVVEPHFLTALTSATATPSIFPDGKRRRTLAESIVDPNNPLSRRVFVNWVWQQHFGRGLVRTPDDFGTRSQPPTHPELLDYLASTFLASGGSLKQLHRQIMLSQVYQQGSVENLEARNADADNKLLWRMPRRRLDLEAMRDSMLAVSGELDVAKIGGRPFELLSHPAVPRRSVYGFVNRDIVSSLASTFDVADANTCTAQRPETTVPQQTLFALNSPFIQDRAAAFAKLSVDIEDRATRVAAMYQRAFGRPPSHEERQAATEFLGDAASDAGTWDQLAHVLLASNEFVFVD
ncbi:Planctomycete cytochrome C [Rosistilla oblonga]|uniref:PSD1 and planctomycete cytochrome C domain-containing protein n=1 Tax=Rosistilla oblonga TaxID=2527990 RepID=UPI001189B472|nr:PSD1 and planctomycete cytochrome C domain-containing protein [Rosistilla oblonga]QDV12805.1 Planctomycete cytochrome C [Rosistilla oblonga]